VKLALNGDQLPGVSKQFSAAQPDHGMPSIGVDPRLMKEPPPAIKAMIDRRV